MFMVKMLSNFRYSQETLKTFSMLKVFARVLELCINLDFKKFNI